MATTFDEIYNRTLRSLKAFEVFKIPEDVLEEQFETMLENAIGRLALDCRTLYEKLQLDFENKHFGTTLDLTEQNIIRYYLVAEYLYPYVNNEKHMRLIMTDKEFRMSSQANILKEVRKTYELALKEGRKLSVKYGEFNSRN